MGRPLLAEDTRPSPSKVAVIGAGPSGLASLKELRSVGFDVTVFERRSDVGGIFTFSEDPSITSATPWTRAQGSKYNSPMSDFPFPDETPIHVSQSEWSDYYRQYANRFDLYNHIVFNVTVKSITRDEKQGNWRVQLEGEDSPRVFDKIVFASGSETKAILPQIEGQDQFEGRLIHGQAYKGPVDFQGKNVVVLGLGNSAADTAAELVGHAAKVYLSHRRGAKIIPRSDENGPLDSFFSWKTSRLCLWGEHYVPTIFQLLADGLLQNWSNKEFGAEHECEQSKTPEWGLEGTAGDVVTIIYNEHLVPFVREGRIKSVRGIKCIVGPRTLELDDGGVLENVDAIIACTGYQADFSLIPDLPHTRMGDGLPSFPDLYQGIFPPAYANSLACVNYCIINETAAAYRELQAMAIAQVWAGKSRLPSRKAMDRQVAEHQEWLANHMRRFPATSLGKARVYPWMKFLHRTAGTGMYEHMGWGWRGWWFWLRERRLYRLVAWGVYSPHMYRLFETGKRETWDGAREAIVRVNEERERAFPKRKTRKADKP